MIKKSKNIQDKGSISQVLGCLVKSPNILINSSYNVTVEDFPERFHKIVFTAIQNLVADRVEVIDIPTICNYLTAFPTHLKVFEDNDGTTYIDTVSDVADISNFDHNYRTVKKFTLLRSLCDNGIDVSDIFDPMETDPVIIGQKNKELKSMTESEIFMYFQSKLNNIASDAIDSSIVKYDSKASIRGAFEELMKAPSIGLPFVDEVMTAIFRGQQGNKMLLEACGSGCVDSNTEFFTGTEWKKISDYEEGDLVLQYDDYEKATLVRPDRYIKVPCEEMNHIETKYGVNQTVCDEHMMLLYDKRSKKLRKTSFADFKDSHEKTTKGCHLSVPTTFEYINGEGIDLTDEQIRVMVAVITDGSFKDDCRERWCQINIKKERKIERLSRLLKDAKIEYSVSREVSGYVRFLFEAPRDEKCFTEYWYNCNRHQREIVADEVLCWGGTAQGKRRSFSTTIKENADFVQFVFSSLGVRATLSTRNRVGEEYLTCDKIYIRKGIEYTVSLSSYSPYVGLGCKEKKMKIERVSSTDGYKYCFTVPSGMFVTRRDGKINILSNCGKTRKQIANCMNLSIPFRYSVKEGKWVKTGVPPQNGKVMYINTELTFLEVSSICLSYLCEINEEKILLHTMSEEEFSRLQKGVELMEQFGFHIVVLESFDEDSLKQLISEYIHKFDVKYIYFDYLMSNAKLLSSCSKKSGIALAEHQALLMLATSLKQFCTKFGIFLYTACQVNALGNSGGDAEARGVNSIRASKAILDKVDYAFQTFRPNKKDLDACKDIIARKYVSTKDVNYGMSVFKNRSGKHVGIYVFYNMDLGTVRATPLFATDLNYNPIEIELLDVIFDDTAELDDSMLNRLEVIDEDIEFREDVDSWF